MSENWAKTPIHWNKRYIMYCTKSNVYFIYSLAIYLKQNILNILDHYHFSADSFRFLVLLKLGERLIESKVIDLPFFPRHLFCPCSAIKSPMKEQHCKQQHGKRYSLETEKN